MLEKTVIKKLTIRKIAALYGFEAYNIMRWCQRGYFQCWKLGSAWYIDEADFQRFLREGRR